MASKKVRKAVIPAAGFGTRLFPSTKVVKKELFPIIDRDGRAKPVIMAIVEEAVNAGIEEVAIVVQPEDKDLFVEFFCSSPSPQLWQKLSPENREYSKYIQDLGDRITFLTQEQQEGYGHAVFCAKDWVDNEPFLLLLGDHVYASNNDTSCAKQIIDVYQQVGKNVIGLTIMSADIIHKAGCVTGKWQDTDSTNRLDMAKLPRHPHNSILEITQVYEKPTLDYAQEHLRVSGLPDNEFLGVFGMYILESTIFDLLAEEITNNLRYKGEFQLTTCLDKLREIDRAKQNLKNYSEKAIDQANDEHIIKSVAKVQKTLAIFREKLALKKLNRLESEVTGCFRYLLHKSNLVHRVAIDNGNFRLSLYDPQGKPLPKQRLSAGEKQLLAIAFLWGLARVSGKNLPIAIDTPLGRLDSSHRNNLVERYFPTASHQVILLSTDTEIGKQEVNLLREQEAIAREYLLNYNSDNGGTTLQEGYFC